MESIHHFSHDEHPLFLKKFGENEEEEELVCSVCQEQITEKDNYYACQGCEEQLFLKKLMKLGEICENKKFVCNGCGEKITEKDNYYACRKERCSFYLHNKCADLPEEINLPCHQHPLTLFATSPYTSGGRIICDMCQRSDWYWFTYHCSLCKFNIDVICSFFMLEGMKNNFQHEAHPHPLTFKLRSSFFHCDACKTEAKDFSYFCTTCQFWIHKRCYSAPKCIKVVHHDDPLVLAYSLPEQHLNFFQFCDICKEIVNPSNWVYYCDDCRYFNHLKCATSNPPSTGESEIQDEESSQLMQFPFPNRESVPDPLSLFVANKMASVAYDDGPTEISHLSSLHHHPFYSCSNFFLHKFCAELPEELLQCPLNSGHSIKVKKNKICIDLFQCSFCLRGCNGFLCECVSCNLELDIGCASNLFPSRIKHDSHGQHPLVRSYLPRGSSHLYCNACNEPTVRSYSCKACSFNLCIICVNYPGSVRHEYDRHSIPLTYPPIKDHPSDFICEICEEDINPRDWMYHCKDCNQSFHTYCLSPTDWYSNVKFGGKVNIDKIHTHPLTFVRNIKSENASLCGQCGDDEFGIPILECAPCGFKLCKDCAKENLRHKCIK